MDNHRVDWQIHDWGQTQGPAAAAAFLLGALIYGGDQRSRRRRQAEQVSAWLKGSPSDWAGQVAVTVHIRNGSDQPIYDVVLSTTRCQTQDLCLSVLPPGETHTEEGTDEMVDLEGSNIYSKDLLLSFRDASNRRWRRTPDGTIESDSGLISTLPRYLPYWGYAATAAIVALWVTARVDSVILARLSFVATLYFLFEAPTYCGAVLRDGQMCRNRAQGLLRGCYYHQHRWQRAKMVAIPRLWGRLARGLWQDPKTAVAAVATLVAITANVVGLITAIHG